MVPQNCTKLGASGADPRGRVRGAGEWHRSQARALLGFFGISLAFEGLDYTGHPTFPRYASALLPHPHTPHRLRDDPELKKELPPEELEGFCWRTGEQIARDWLRDERARGSIE
jgi:hypothetical protein